MERGRSSRGLRPTERGANDGQQREDTRTLQQFTSVHDVFADTGTSCVLLLRSSHLRAQALLLLPQIRCGLGAEILRLEHLANLDLRLAWERVGAALDPIDRFLFDFTRHNQKPAISSFVSANGPSITVRFAPENLSARPSNSAGVLRPPALRRPSPALR